METLYSFDWASVKMEAALVIFAVLALLSAVALPRRFQTSVSALAFVGMYLALILACVFADRLMYCAYGCLIVICALLTSQMSFSFFDKLGRSGQSRNEYIAVVMMSAAGLFTPGAPAFRQMGPAGRSPAAHRASLPAGNTAGDKCRPLERAVPIPLWVRSPNGSGSAPG